MEDDCDALQRRCDDTERRYGGLANDWVREGYKKEKEHRLLASQSSWGGIKEKVRDLEDDCGALQRRCDDTERRYGGPGRVRNRFIFSFIPSFNRLTYSTSNVDFQTNGPEPCNKNYTKYKRYITYSDKNMGKSKLQVPDTGMSQYWSILEHFWCTSIAQKCDPYVI